MADMKRKTLQIKRPDPNAIKSKKKPLPQINLDNRAATSAVDTDELASMGPKTAKLRRPEETSLGGESGKTTRIALPDEDKIRKARRATATQDLGEEGSLPSAEQIAQAQKNATMPIVIDTEDVSHGPTDAGLGAVGRSTVMDRTMEIDAEALATRDVESDLRRAGAEKGDARDQTMKIDPSALATGNLEQALADADRPEDTKDHTLKIDTDALADEEQDAATDQTMEIDPVALRTGKVEPSDVHPIQAQETMQMDPVTDEFLENGEAEAPETVEQAVEEMRESFNAQTMEMDPHQLANDLAEADEVRRGADPERGKTMDLSQERPKTIMIKRPTRDAAPNTPTVKAVRPDAATLRAARPVTAVQSQPKQSTSRVDMPAEGGAGKDGKTIKLRRPAGATVRSKTQISRVASGAGLVVNDDGTVTAIIRPEEQLGGGWLAVAVITCLLSLGAIYTSFAILEPELPMPGRVVNADNLITLPVAN